MFDCGVPAEHCTGSVVKTQARVHDGYKAHGDYDGARRCQRRYGVIVNAERAERGESILLFGKPQRLKPGKSGEKGGKGGKRFMAPKVRG